MKKACADFLELNINEKYDLIVLNPPWKKLGIEFIKKSVSLLKNNGTLICVMDYNKFTRNKSEGSFYDLNNRGTFDYIWVQTSSTGSSKFESYFKGIGDSIYFIWTNSKKDKKTKIKNRINEEFYIKIPKSAKYPPMFEDEYEFIDWDSGVRVKTNGTKSVWKEDMYAIKLRRSEEDSDVFYLQKGTPSPISGSFIPCMLVNEKKLKKFIFENREKLIDGYMTSHGWLRLPPLKRDIVC